MGGRTTPKKGDRGNVFRQALDYQKFLDADLTDDPDDRRNRGKLREAARAARLHGSPRRGGTRVSRKQS